MTKKIIIADTGPIIALALLDLIKDMPEVIGEIIIPHAVYLECTYDLSKPAAKSIQLAVTNGQMQVKNIAHSNLYKELTELLDPGEAEAITLFHKICADLLLIDEMKGRSIAEKQQIPIIGTIAILLKVKEKGVRPLVKPMIDKLTTHNYRLSKALIKYVLNRSGESSG